jgi:hypothetical protein
MRNPNLDNLFNNLCVGANNPAKPNPFTDLDLDLNLDPTPSGPTEVVTGIGDSPTPPTKPGSRLIYEGGVMRVCVC